ncbi:MAG: hypothetical protein Q4G67_09185 [Actinomycetia bacterium]|nr:hypothetical protein [Actinomycetes bacterium]
MTIKPLTAPLVATGVLMAAYLALRPYGDMADPTSLEAAAAFASPRWVFAHLAGALALASLARLALRLHDLVPSVRTRIARSTGLAGAVLVLPYYGAETFGLHAIGQAALGGDGGVMDLVAPVRDHPAALTTFGLGLLLLAVSAIVSAWAWQRNFGSAAGWPLGILAALVLPQYYLPPIGRILFGVLYLLAAVAWLVSLPRASWSERTRVTGEEASVVRGAGLRESGVW